ncbi:MAG: diguanylate cyclase, partial [Clostridia bacterium]|nr:diguanylate cyclase [Clostridia bacterium]
MVKYIVKRILISLLILFGVSVILYFLIRLMPVNYIENQYYAAHGQTAVSQEALDALLKQYNLHDSSFFGICKGYFDWLWKFMQGD